MLFHGFLSVGRCGDGGDAKRPRLEPSAPEPSLDQTLFEILRSGAGDVRTAARAGGSPAITTATAPPASFTHRLQGSVPPARPTPAPQADKVSGTVRIPSVRRIRYPNCLIRVLMD